GLRGFAGGLVLQPEPAVVAPGEQVLGPPCNRRIARTRLVPAGGIRDLHVADAVGVPLAGRIHVLAVGGRVVAVEEQAVVALAGAVHRDRKSTRLNSSHVSISYAVF